ncbi:MAG: AI-2E family transporter [Gammaproteobacteria bacterium]
MSKKLSEEQTNNVFDIDRLIRIVLIAAITFWSFKLALPFIGLLAWGLILAVALYPVYYWLSHRLGGRPILAASIITFFSLLIVVGSIVILTNNMVDSISDIISKVHSGEQIIPQPPESIRTWPLIGDHIQSIWSLASSNLGDAIKTYASYLVHTGSFVVSLLATKGKELILFILAVIFSGYVLAHATNMVDSVRKLAKRIHPERGTTFVKIMTETIQNVSRGVIGVSLLQSLIFGLILLFAGIPGAGLITFLALIMGIAQIGLTPLVIPLAIWLFFTKSFAFAFITTFFMLLTLLVDNLKPFVMAKGLRTPLMVIFTGVIGGLLLHGVIGVFIGPVILAIFYELVYHWINA